MRMTTASFSSNVRSLAVGRAPVAVYGCFLVCATVGFGLAVLLWHVNIQAGFFNAFSIYGSNLTASERQHSLVVPPIGPPPPPPQPLSQCVDAPHYPWTFPKAPYEGVAVIVEHRPCSTLAITIQNVEANIPKDWPIVLYYAPAVGDYIENSKLLQVLIRSGRVRAEEVKVPLRNTNDYSLFLMDQAFWLNALGEKVLVFQSDSAICSNTKYQLRDFLQYDYIGAPWPRRWYGMLYGNGGFSLRDRVAMLKLFKRRGHCKYSNLTAGTVENEDIWFCLALFALQKEEGFNLPTEETAAKFALESVTVPIPDDFFAIHQLPHARDTPENYTEVMKKVRWVCPEADHVIHACGGLPPSQNLSLI